MPTLDGPSTLCPCRARCREPRRGSALRTLRRRRSRATALGARRSRDPRCAGVDTGAGGGAPSARGRLKRRTVRLAPTAAGGRTHLGGDDLRGGGLRGIAARGGVGSRVRARPRAPRRPAAPARALGVGLPSLGGQAAASANTAAKAVSASARVQRARRGARPAGGSARRRRSRCAPRRPAARRPLAAGGQVLGQRLAGALGRVPGRQLVGEQPLHQVRRARPSRRAGSASRAKVSSATCRACMVG